MASAMLGRGAVLEDSGPTWPRWPTFVSSEVSLEKALVGLEEARPMPVDLRHVPAAIEYRADTERHHHYVVRWNERVMFDDGKLRASVWFDAGLGDDLAKACAWTYFKACYERGRAVGRRAAGKGPRPQPPAVLADDGLYYHGGIVNHEFVCWPGP